MDHQDRLFRLAVEAGHIHIRHVPASGWWLSIHVRRGDESWQEATVLVYSGLSTRELIDVICESVTVLL